MRNRGITLISLVITIIVLLIIASTATYTGIETVKSARLSEFVTNLQIIQQKVNEIYQEKKYGGFDSSSEIFSIPLELQGKASLAYESAKAEIEIEKEINNFCYFNEESLSKYLGLDDIDMNIIICFETRDVIGIDGIEYDGTMHFVQDNLPGGVRNIKYENVQTPGFKLEKLNYGLYATIKISEIMSNNGRVMYREVGTYKGKDENGNKIYEEKPGSYWQEIDSKQITIKKTGNYEFKVINDYGDEHKSYINVTLVNEPKLTDGMIPIRWNGANWVVTSANSGEWYNYEEQLEDDGTSKWANIMLSDGTYKSDTVQEGQIVQESELGSMFVWIPRYMYEIEPQKDNEGNDIENTGYHTENAGVINIKFLKGNTNVPTDNTTVQIKTEAGNYNWLVHPCFKDGTNNNFKNGEWDEEITGIWVAKFLSSETDGKMESKPGKQALVNKTISEMYEKGRNANYGVENSKFDSHLIKNSEWGAVVYLSYSKYGRNEIEINSSNASTTGNNYIENVLASTTGNVYGIYDLVGGNPYNRVAGYFEGTNLENYGESLVQANKKYKNVYTEYSKENYGDALYEISSQSANINTAWYSDRIHTSQGIFLYRGFSGYNMFSISGNSGDKSADAGMRTVIIN